MTYFRKASRTAWLFGLVALLAACSSIPVKERQQAARLALPDRADPAG